MIGVYGLGVIGNTVVAVGDRKVIAWDLPVADCASDAWVGPGDGSWTITRNHSSGYTTRGASFSPDSRYIALTDQYSLYIYSTSTGELIWRETRLNVGEVLGSLRTDVIYGALSVMVEQSRGESVASGRSTQNGYLI